MDDQKAGTLRIDPKNGAVVINETLRIEPHWTLEELVQSHVYKKYIHYGDSNKFKILLIKNIEERRTTIKILLSDTGLISIVTIKFSHGGPGEAAQMGEADFVVLREILYQSFSNYESEDDSDGYISYDFPWGSATTWIDNRDFYSQLSVSYRGV